MADITYEVQQDSEEIVEISFGNIQTSIEECDATIIESNLELLTVNGQIKTGFDTADLTSFNFDDSG